MNDEDRADEEGLVMLKIGALNREKLWFFENIDPPGIDSYQHFSLFFWLIFCVAQFLALEEENQRRREECVQLRAILAEQSQGNRVSNLPSLSPFDINDEHDLNDALQAQKLVNR